MTTPRPAGEEVPLLPSPAALFWRRQARWTARRYNLGCVLGAFLPAFFALSAVFACALLFVRERGTAGRGGWIIYVAGTLACLGFALWRTRGRFFTLDDALVRLDTHLGLHNRLGAAAAGVGAYPPARSAVRDGYAFRWGRVVSPAAGAVALVWVAAVLPVSRHASAFVPVVAPVAWTQTAQWLDTLQKSDMLQEPALEEMRERLEQLRKQPAKDWYSQSSLEAGDSLRDQTQKSIEALQRDLRTALSDVDAARQFNEQTSPGEMKSVGDNLNNALKGLEMGNLPLNQELLGQLQEMDLSNARMLTKEQMEELQRRLKEGAQVCEACLGEGDPDADADAVLVRVKGGKPDKGGGGPAPLTLDEKPTDLGSKARDSVSNPNMDHALPGEVVALSKADHAIDPAKYTGPVSGGTAANPGEGGEAVWRNDLTPREREVLKSFFK